MSDVIPVLPDQRIRVRKRAAHVAAIEAVAVGPSSMTLLRRRSLDVCPACGSAMKQFTPSSVDGRVQKSR